MLVTWGDRTPTPSPDYMFAIFPEKHADDAMQFANEAKHKVRMVAARWHGRSAACAFPCVVLNT